MKPLNQVSPSIGFRVPHQYGDRFSCTEALREFISFIRCINFTIQRIVYYASVCVNLKTSHSLPPITLSTSGAVPYWYKLFRYSLDLYGTTPIHTCTGTVPVCLSTLRTERTKLHRNEPHKILGLGSESNGTECAIHAGMWTDGAVPFRYCTDQKPSVWTGYYPLQIGTNPLDISILLLFKQKIIGGDFKWRTQVL